MENSRGAEVLDRLMEGNRRLIDALTNDGDISPAIRRETAEEGQHPEATVLTCSDSRVVPEDTFMVGIGELFVVRVAGNVVLPSQAASVVYGAAHLGTPLVLVMGHSGCGAVAAALDGNDEEALACLVDPIREAVAGCDDPLEASKRNMAASMAELRRVPELARLEREGEVTIAGALYHLETGRVELLDDPR